jgi:hypothetical protein
MMYGSTQVSPSMQRAICFAHSVIVCTVSILIYCSFDCMHALKLYIHRSSAAKRSTTAAARYRHVDGDASDGSCDRENNNNCACSSAHSNDSDVLGGVRYVQLRELCLALQYVEITAVCVSMRIGSVIITVLSD